MVIIEGEMLFIIGDAPPFSQLEQIRSEDAP